MKNRLPRLTIVVLIAAAAYAGHRGYESRRQAADELEAAPSDGATPVAAARDSDSDTRRLPRQSSGPAGVTPGDQLLLQAITQLERRESVAARLRHQVSLSGRQLFGVGNYWQQGNGDALRVRLELQTAVTQTSLLQVSNGRFLWTDRQLPTGRSITRLDLRQLRADATRAAADVEAIGPGQATWSPIRPELLAHHGGLPKLLAALADAFSFSPPQAMRLTVGPPLVHQTTTLPVFAVVGHWKPGRLAEIVPKHQMADAEIEAAQWQRRLQALPPRVPQEVLLLVGQTDLFPHRVEYRRLLNPPSTDGAAERPTPYQLSADPLVLLEFSEVSFNVPIAAGQFDFSPGDTEWDDRTAEHLERLRRNRQQQFATRNQAGQQR